MTEKLPSLSLFRKGNKVVIGSVGFGIHGVIVNIDSKSPFPIKVSAGFSDFELSLKDYNKTWFFLTEDDK